MELKNDNSNGCNVVINNLHPMGLFFQKILKIELNKGLQILFCGRKSIIACKLKFLITFISLIKMEWFKAFHEYKSRKPISNFYFLRKWFKKKWGCTKINEITYHTITF